ncbi:hypothetical protein [Pseudomonas oryzihabitans]|uniref:hypothetical protein n=1 Tax=Pseudomonas oryzihabitans TaxID=47885 RepID=UPI001120B574|nr:hypothetical protein [Pseudomonas psychrotolerans]QDD91920.1 hypothetical protein CCZ28_24070 [Pseudomonas psychrotolerans]
MRIVNREAFLAMPAGTVFCKYEPCVFGNLEIKGESTVNAQGEHIDYWSQDLAGALKAENSGDYFEAIEAAEAGQSVAMDFDCQSRDGLYEQDQLFAVWEPHDVLGLIRRLHQANLGA